jgi:hypothetical protein
VGSTSLHIKEAIARMQERPLRNGPELSLPPDLKRAATFIFL